MPAWAVALRFVLMPLDSLACYFSSKRGYQVETDTWLIGGVKYTGRFFYDIANSPDVAFRFEKQGDALMVTRIELDALRKDGAIR